MTQFFLAAASDEYALIKWAGTIDWLIVNPKTKTGIDRAGDHWTIAVLKQVIDIDGLGERTFDGYLDLGLLEHLPKHIELRLLRAENQKRQP